MKISMNYEEIFGPYLKKLLDFCFQSIDKVSLTNYCNPYYTTEEFQIAKKELLLHETNQRRKEYGQSLLSEFQLNQELTDIGTEAFGDGISYMEKQATYVTRTIIDNRLQKIGNNYQLINRKATCITPFTTSFGVMELFTFQINDKLKQILYNMDDLFSHIELHDEIILEDPTFYRGEEEFLVVGSHEQYASLNLSIEEYQEFLMLDLSHIVQENIWWHDEYLNKYEKNDGKFPFIDNRATISNIEGFNYIFNSGELVAYEE